ncbi:MAG: YncE family protein [Bacteroidetes bacterium]|nr:YncE family protein [Bacteroidota bacterium]
MKNLFCHAIACLFSFCFIYSASAQGQSGYKLSKTFKIASSGGWDYIAVWSGKVYVSHGTQVNILDAKTGDSLGYIPNTTGVHGIAFNESAGKGYTSNGRINNITVFDLKTNQVLKQIAVGENPDAIMYDKSTNKIITCNGRSHDLSIVDATSETVTSTIPLEGKPETAVSDGMGKIFVNIEDKNKIAVVDLKSNKVINSWSTAPGESPTGLAIDLKTNRLFAGCEKMLIVVDATNGKVVDKLAIADGCDGVAFDNELKYVFASCGEGKLTVIHEVSGDEFKVVDNVPTKRSARTIALDEQTHDVFLPAADMQPNPVAGQRPNMIPGTFQVIVVSK